MDKINYEIFTQILNTNHRKKSNEDNIHGFIVVRPPPISSPLSEITQSTNIFHHIWLSRKASISSPR